MPESKLKIGTLVSFKKDGGKKLRGKIYSYTPHGTYIVLGQDGNLYELQKPKDKKKEHCFNAHLFFISCKLIVS